MPEIFLFPRLPARAARSRLIEVTGKTAHELTAMVATNHHEAVFAATGGTRVRETVFGKLREALLESARQLGYPSSTRQDRVLSFDPEAGRILLESLPIAPGEASRDEFWSFVSLVVVPDVATWRFPDQNERRLLGGVRNVFQRLWWRAYLLHDAEREDPWWLLRLPEDALVGLMERPGISSNPVVTRNIARGIHEVAALPADLREDAWRDAYKRIRQRFPLVNFDALSDREVAEQMTAICRNTIKEFLKRKSIGC